MVCAKILFFLHKQRSVAYVCTAFRVKKNKDYINENEQLFIDIQPLEMLR